MNCSSGQSAPLKALFPLVFGMLFAATALAETSILHPEPDEVPKKGEEEAKKSPTARTARAKPGPTPQELFKKAQKRIDKLEERVQALRRSDREDRKEKRIKKLEEQVRFLAEQLLEMSGRSEQAIRQARERIRTAGPPLTQEQGKKTEEKPDPGKQAYQEAFNDVIAGNYEEAIAGLKQFLEDHSDSAWADNALFWLGESLYTKQDYAGAAKRYKKLLQNYPESGKAASAAYKLGYTYYHLDDYRAARKTLLKLLKSTSDVRIRERAKHLLEKIRKELTASGGGEQRK